MTSFSISYRFFLIAFLFYMEHCVQNFRKVLMFRWVTHKKWAKKHEYLDETSHVGKISQQSIGLARVLKRNICVSKVYSSKTFPYLAGGREIIIILHINYLGVYSLFFLGLENLNIRVKRWNRVLSDKNITLSWWDWTKFHEVVKLSTMSEGFIFNGWYVV